MGRHRHAVNVRADGLATVLGPLLRDPRVRAATLVDVDSGMVLDACPGDGSAGDVELLGAGHAELVRVVLGFLGGPMCEVVVGAGGDRHHVARVVPDPHGDRLALAVVVDGPRRVVDRTLKRLRQVSAAALTAGPTTSRRPMPGGWPMPPAERREPVAPHGPTALPGAPPRRWSTAWATGGVTAGSTAGVPGGSMAGSVAGSPALRPPVAVTRSDPAISLFTSQPDRRAPITAVRALVDGLPPAPLSGAPHAAPEGVLRGTPVGTPAGVPPAPGSASEPAGVPSRPAPPSALPPGPRPAGPADGPAGAGGNRLEPRH